MEEVGGEIDDMREELQRRIENTTRGGTGSAGFANGEETREGILMKSLSSSSK